MAHRLRQLQTATRHGTISLMKILLALILAESLAACGNSNTTTPAPETSASSPTVGTKGAGGGGRR